MEIVMDRSHGNYVKWNFLSHNRLRLYFYVDDNQFWVLYQHILSTINAPLLQIGSGGNTFNRKKTMRK